MLRLAVLCIGCLSFLIVAFAPAPPAAAAGPVGDLVKDIHPGPLGSSVFYLTGSGDGLFFRALDGTAGAELWTSDGDPAGTLPLQDIVPGSGSSFPNEITDMGSYVMFEALGTSSSWQLWRSDGTVAGTSLVSSATLIVEAAAALDGTLYFRGSDSAAGVEPWISDGTTAGTHVLLDVRGGTSSSHPGAFRPLGDRVLFQAASAYDAVNGYDYEPWITDGTAGGTHRVKDVEPGPRAGGFDPIGVVGDEMIFWAFNSATGTEIWKTDGTAEGTALVKDINPGGGTARTTGARGEAALLGLVWFNAQTNEVGGNASPWVTDGTAAGTVMLADLNGVYDAGIFEFVEWQGAVWFTADEGGGPGVATALYRSDGTPAGTTRQTGINSYTSLELVPFADALYYVGDDYQLYRTDGVSSGVLVPTGAAGYIDKLTVVGERLFFEADDPATGKELWAVRNPTIVGAEEPPAVPVGGLQLRAWPSPAASSTRIAWSQARPGPATLALFDVSGRRVRTLRDGVPFPAGAHEVSWDGRDDLGRALPGGVYFARLTAGEETASRRIVRVR